MRAPTLRVADVKGWYVTIDSQSYGGRDESGDASFVHDECMSIRRSGTLRDGGGRARYVGAQISKDRLITRSPRPQDLETPPHLLTSWITPTDLFYVRSHFYAPTVREADWSSSSMARWTDRSRSRLARFAASVLRHRW